MNALKTLPEQPTASLNMNTETSEIRTCSQCSAEGINASFPSVYTRVAGGVNFVNIFSKTRDSFRTEPVLVLYI